jgi:hypothetical protein
MPTTERGRRKVVIILTLRREAVEPACGWVGTLELSILKGYKDWIVFQS